MDKVIIDGVDVSGCDSYTSNYREPMPYGEIKVTEHYCWHINSNCDGKNCDYKEIKRLQQENERLKQEWRLDCLKCEYKNTKADVDKYKQSLQEIRAMATLFHSVNENKDLDHFKNNILAKINEVIGAE